MSRKVKRVPLDFDAPLEQVWPGYLMPHSLREKRCGICGGSGYSADARRLQDLWYGDLPFDPANTGSVRLTAETPAVRNFAERNVTRAPWYYGTDQAAVVQEANRLAELWNGMWCHHLDQDDVDALIEADRLYDFTHTWSKGTGWQSIEPVPAVTAEQVNTWSLHGFGHDSSNCHVVISAKCKRLGVPELCARCGGHGSIEKYEGQRAEAEAWERTEPPVGDGWQLWETVSEGSPISPVFAAADGLASWMSDPARGKDRVLKDVAARFIEVGWAPTAVASASTGFVSGVEFVGRSGKEADGNG